jgi:Domain of unkown function (DUF1775)
MRRMVRGAALVSLSLSALLLGAGTASADVVVAPEQVDPAARDVTLVFRVTDGSGPRTTRLQVFLPTGRPLVGVEAPAPPGWTAQLTTTELAVPAPSADGPVDRVVTAIDWTATATATAAPTADAVELPVRVGLMPDGAGPVRFHVVRTDAGGRTAEWADTWAEGAPKPAHDALLIRLGAPPPPVVVGTHGDHHGDESAIAGAASAGPATPGAIAASIGGLALLVGAVGALVTSLGRRQRRRFEAVSPHNRPESK